MSEARTREPVPHMEFNEVAGLFAQYDELSMPYWQAAFLQSAIDHELDGVRQNRVEDGYLITSEGARHRLATDQEFSALEALAGGARIAAGEKLGIDPELFDDLRTIVQEEKMRRDHAGDPAYRHMDRPLSYVTGGLSQPRSMDGFLNAYKTLADLTGETFEAEVMENMVTIEPDEPIEVIKGRLADSFRTDRTLWRFQTWNEQAAKRYEEDPDSYPGGIVRQLDVSEIEQVLADFPAPDEEVTETPSDTAE
ncbi:MAG TPA: hypothetical protein VD706_02515 [Candidatus Saccharimonadales bacterium]|nr:hypothetical protein [Candidatus Saccharimonadales bacterium]